MKKDDKKLIALLAICLAALVFVALSPWIFPDCNAHVEGARLQAPSTEHFFGTDNLGRDLFARTFNGLRISLLLAFSVQIISLLVGIIVGSVTGYFGGLIDRVYVLIQNVMMSFPSLIATLSLIVLLGTGLKTLIIALSITEWISYARIIRGEIKLAREMDYVKGSRAIGSSTYTILVKHILPNVLNPIVPLFTLMIGHTVLSIAGLGFLGFGVQPPMAEIGLMVKDGLSYLGSAPWLFFLPGLMLVVYSILFSVIGDKLQDKLNPQNDLYLM